MKYFVQIFKSYNSLVQFKIINKMKFKISFSMIKAIVQKNNI
jgi:hypothetical protein